jgi:hypothetical protein
MSKPETPPKPETGIERALRLKKAAQAARPERPGAGAPGRKASAAMAAGASKPALRK